MITTTYSSDNGAVSPSRPGAPRGRSRYYYLFLLRRNLGVTLAYALLLFILFPLQYILAADSMARTGGPTASQYNPFTGPGGLFSPVFDDFSVILVAAVPALLSILNLNYMHQKNSTDLFHALPIKRTRMLLVSYAANATITLVPLALNFAVSTAAAALYRMPWFSFARALPVLFVLCAGALGVLAVCTLTAVLTGTLFDHIIYAFGALAAPSALVFVFLFSSELTLYGYSQNMRSDVLYKVVSPFLFPLCIFSPSFDDTRRSYQYVLGNEHVFVRAHPAALWIMAAIWFLLSALILFAALILYRRRKSETAGKTGYDHVLTVALKICAAFGGGLLLSAVTAFTYITDNKRSHLFPIAFFAVLGGILTYCIVQCVMNRGLHTLARRAPFALISGVLPAVFIVVMLTGGLGYEERVPALDTIESVDMIYSDAYRTTRYDAGAARTDAGNSAGIHFEESHSIRLTQPDAIALVHSMHQEHVLNRRANDGRYYFNQQVYIKYHLKGGGTLARVYHNIGQEQGIDSYNRLNACEEVKRQLHPIFTLEAQDIRAVSLMNRVYSGIMPLHLTQEQTTDLIEALRADMLAETYDQMTGARVKGYISLTPKLGTSYFQSGKAEISDGLFPRGNFAFDDCYVRVTDQYAETLSLLNSFGAGGFDRIDLPKIDAAYVSLSFDTPASGAFQIDGPRHFSPNAYSELDYEQQAFKSRAAKITDSSEIEKLVSLAKTTGSDAVLNLYRDTVSDQEAGGMDRTRGVVLKMILATSDGSNAAYSLYINPSEVSADLLERLRASYAADQKEQYGEFYQEETIHQEYDELLSSIREAKK